MQVDDRQNVMASDNPFSASSVHHPFYASPSLTQRLDLLQHLVEYSHQPILVLGEPGAGKTRMLDELTQRAEENWRVAVVDAGHTGTETELLALLATAYGVLIEGGETDEQFTALEAQLQAYTRAMLIPVLLLDNGQLLTDAALERLLDLMQPGEAYDGGLRVVLFCEPGAGAGINARVLARHAQGITHSIDIPALSDEQIDAYLALYMAQVEGGDGGHFNDDEFDLICRESAGLPGQINRIAAQLLAGEVSGDDAESRPVRGAGYWLLEPGRGRYLVLGVVLLGGAATVMWQWLAPAEDATVPDQDRIALALPETGGEGGEALAKIPAVEISVETPGQADDASGPAETPATTVAGSAVATESLPKTAPASASQGVDAIPSAPATGKGSLATAAAGDTSSSAAQPVSPTLAPAVMDARPGRLPAGTQVPPATSQGPNVTTGPQSPASVSAMQRSETTAKPESRPKPKSEPISEPTSGVRPKSVGSSVAGHLKGEAWLASLPPGAYVIQLFGSYDKAGALAFIHKHRKLGNFALLRSRHKRRDWYVVVHGQYAGKRQALRAVRRLPASLRRLKPWAREAAPLLEAVRLAN